MTDLGRRVPAARLSAALVLGLWAGGAEAGSGIIVTDTTVMPSGDPVAVYDFKLGLDPGNTIVQGDYIDILNVADYSGVASYDFMVGNIDYSQFFKITSTPDALGGTDIQLELTAGPPLALINLGAADVSIGELIVETTVDFSDLPTSPLLTMLSYTSQTHVPGSGATNSGSGVTSTPTVVPTPALVPTPSSLALIGAGLVPSWVLLAVRRLRRPNRA